MQSVSIRVNPRFTRPSDGTGWQSGTAAPMRRVRGRARLPGWLAPRAPVMQPGPAAARDARATHTNARADDR